MPERVPKTDFVRVFQALTSEPIEFIVIGGIAAIAHGLGRSTYDVDVVYNRTPENFRLLTKALKPFRPYLRGNIPADLPFEFDERTLRNGLNFTLLTPIGGIDLLGEVAGNFYQDLLPFSQRMRGYGREFLAVNLDKLIELKRAAGRTKDNETIAELEALRQDILSAEQNRPDHS